MVISTCVLAFTLSGAVVGFDDSLDDHVSLLQLQMRRANHSKLFSAQSHLQPQEAGKLERQQCPHEIEEELALQGDKRYGCEGTLAAEETMVCSFWGEPHVSNRFIPKPPRFPLEMDVFYKPGLFRMASAKDGSWEVQIHNCGVWTSAMAARLGKTIFEAFVDGDGILQYYVDGKKVDSLPHVSARGLKLDSTHRSITLEGKRGARAPEHAAGTCVDDPGGTLNIDLAQDPELLGIMSNSRRNLNIKLEAKAGSAVDDDPLSFCYIPWDGVAYVHSPFDNLEQLDPSQSLFTIGNQMCAGCNGPITWCRPKIGGPNGWGGCNAVTEAAAKATCEAHEEKPAGAITLQKACEFQGIAIADAASACDHLQDDPEFFQDCQVDYCVSGGNVVAAAVAKGEEAIEHPLPQCAREDCDAASACCNALRDGAILSLDTVTSNNLCNGGELRFGSALIQNNQAVDLVVKAVGGLECKGKMDNSRFGSTSAQIGTLAVSAGTQQTFEFSFVKHRTDDAYEPQSLVMSFLDLDQGKKGKQRESVEVCGGADAITTDDTELEIAVTDDCIKLQSSTHGNARDNPKSLESMSQTQRARVVAFPVEGSSFTATLGVSKKGNNPRKFQFAGHPSVACVLK